VPDAYRRSTGVGSEGAPELERRGDPEIDVPDSDEVFDATDLAREEIETVGGD